MDYLTIPSWKDYQHYKDRDPPWIKLHFSLLSSRAWVMLDDASKLLAIACMLIASRNHGKVPNDPDYIKRVAYISKADFKPLIKCGFLEDASNCLQEQAKATTEERREETETDVRFNEFWLKYPRKEGKVNARKAWSSANVNGSFDLITEALRCQVAVCKDLTYFPHAATWIRGRRWEDEIVSIQDDDKLRNAI